MDCFCIFLQDVKAQAVADARISKSKEAMLKKEKAENPNPNMMVG